MSMTFKSCKAAALSLFRSGASFTRDEDGATAIEYGLIASLIIIAIIGAMKAIAAAYSYILWRRENAGRAYDVN